ncbi:hypothetical protein TOPH_06626 [Tolypocladium ophioglossoides CBS 100239]|uniref:Uncharacterized protein n=1 Tax=Tolypocladium ophioglossoides (strain CBS 100239) TaxID=1163406 RepID=A0A0L0N3X8_TOLOC|nr:hypothetical protein TOPH_06626 [Tolypocladium ophioglossoides CBS 100239]
MSIFSNLRKSRHQAKEHNAKLAGQQKKEQEKMPYRHVPTHAATDAFASAPPSWREADRPRIIEQNRRRSAMAASGQHMNMPGVPRVGSSLSRVSYPGEDVAPMVRLPRAYSYNGISPYPDRSREVVYSAPDISLSQPASLKGKDVAKGPGYEPLRISPAPSKGEPSPVDSSSGSTSSQDDLEMRPSRPTARLGESTHRLHPSHHRRTSDASANSAKASGPSGYARDSRPPPSMRGFASINQVAAPLPTPLPMHLGFLPPVAPSHAMSSTQGYANGSLTPGMQTSRQNSTTSLPGLTPASTRPAASGPATPAIGSASQSEYSLSWVSASTAELDVQRSTDAAGVAYPVAEARTFKERRTARTTRFSELERIESTGVEPSYQDPGRADRSRAPRPAARDDLVNVFPEPASFPKPAASSSSKSKKLSKGGGKLLKKNRWSSSKTSAVAA